MPQKRVALVIGNSAYRHTPRLENPRNDATDVGAALTRLGFHVIEGFDLDKAAFDKASATSPPRCTAPKRRVLLCRARAAGVGPELSGAHRCATDEPSLRSTWRWYAWRSVQRTMERQRKDQYPLLRCLPRQSSRRATSPGPWARARLEIGRGLAAVGERRGHAHQLLDAAGKRGARRQGPQLALFRRARQAIAHVQRRPERHPDRRAQRRHEGDRPASRCRGSTRR